MSAHTPGPWVTNGFNIFGPLSPRSRHENGRELVGGVVDDANDWRNRPVGNAIERAQFREERIANARLIAAAPDMLAALERARELLSQPCACREGYLCGVCEWEALRRAAVEKARGQ